jgi:ABC-2 type transport system ATP-binding protein
VEPAISIDGASIRFGTFTAVDRVSFDVGRGEVFGLLGPNGSGKTTTVHILSTLIAADAGTVRVAGFDVVTEADQVRARIGVTGQFSAVEDLFTGAENLRLMADLHHLPKALARRRIDDLLTRFGLTDAASKPAVTYSGGMRRRLDLAMTLIGDPEVIFLDEPTTGLDPRSRRDVCQLVRSAHTSARHRRGAASPPARRTRWASSCPAARAPPGTVIRPATRRTAPS